MTKDKALANEMEFGRYQWLDQEVHAPNRCM